MIIFASYTEDGIIFESTNVLRDNTPVPFVEFDILDITTSHEYYVDVETGSPVHKGEQTSPHYAFNYTTKQWEDPRTLQDFKDAQWTLIKQARTDTEYAGFTWDGSTFDSDAISQNRITGAVTLAMMSPSFVIDWVLADNTTRLLDQSGMAQVGAALGTHVTTQFAKGVMLRAAIEAATTQAEVEAVVW